MDDHDQAEKNKHLIEMRQKIHDLEQIIRDAQLEKTSFEISLREKDEELKNVTRYCNMINFKFYWQLPEITAVFKLETNWFKLS